MVRICVQKRMYLYLSSALVSNGEHSRSVHVSVCNRESISVCKTNLLISSSLYKQQPIIVFGLK